MVGGCPKKRGTSGNVWGKDHLHRHAAMPRSWMAPLEEYRNGHSYGNGKEESLWGNATWKAQTSHGRAMVIGLEVSWSIGLAWFSSRV